MKEISGIINDNDGRFKKPKQWVPPSEVEIDRIADILVDMLGRPESREYYCKVARHLPEATLVRIAVTAREIGREPGKLFTFLTKKESGFRNNV